MKLTYEFTIREVLERTVRVDADSKHEAESMVEDLYDCEKIVLNAEDLVDEKEIELDVIFNDTLNENEGIEHYITNDEGKIVDKFE